MQRLTPPKKFSKDEIESIPGLYRSGLTCREIGKILGVNGATILKRLKSTLLPGEMRKAARYPNKKYPPRKMKHFRKLDDQVVSHILWHLNIGVSDILLAKYFNVSRNTIWKIKRKLIYKHVEAKPAPPLWISEEMPMRLRGERLKKKIREKVGA